MTEAEITLLADRRVRGPWGTERGADGLPGNASVVRADGSIEKLAGKSNVCASKGERIRIETPGGGGWERKDQDR